jgi:hypothetical protein
MTLNIPAGTECCDSVIDQLRAHGAEWVRIATTESRSEDELERRKLVALDRLQHLFRHADLKTNSTSTMFHALLAYRGMR